MVRNGVKPPYCNTGAQNTYEQGLRPLVDWVSVTFKNVQVDELIEDVLLLNSKDFIELERGKWGYMNAKQYGHISVLYNGHKDMGIHLEMTGQGCREYEAHEIMDWQTLFRVMLHCEGKFTRTDLAIDDFAGYLNIKNIWRKAKNGEVVSKYKKGRKIEEIELGDGKSVGYSVYFGREQSRIRIRFYDKLLEQKAEGNDCEGLTVWNRAEIQARDERAHAIAALIADGLPVGDIAKGVLKHYLRFVVKGKDKNKARWKTAPFWDKFLRDVEGLRLATSKPKKTIEDKFNWLSKQVAPTIAMVIDAFDGDMSAIYKLISEGKQRLKPKDYALISEFKQQNNPINSLPQKQAI